MQNAAPAIRTTDFQSNSILDSKEVTFILDTTLKQDIRHDPLALKFILSYVQCRDVRQACKTAGINIGVGRKLRQSRDVHLAITKLTEQQVMKYGFDTEELVAKVKDVVFADPVDLENEDGSYKTKLSDLPPETRRAIKKFKVKNLFGQDANGMTVKIGELVEVEMYDRMIVQVRKYLKRRRQWSME